jgi:hypothetical protein
MTWLFRTISEGSLVGGRLYFRMLRSCGTNLLRDYVQALPEGRT